MLPLLVTGADGFLGNAVCAELRRRGLPWRAAVRARRPERLPCEPSAGWAEVGELGPATDWRAALDGVGAVIHLAAAAHEAAASGPAALFRVNAEAAATLADQARRAGVSRLVLASSVKAMGEATPPGMAWTEDAPCAPTTAYGRSKRAAEEAWLAAGASGAIVLRLPLVYGPGVRANLERLMLAIRRRRLLPFGAVRNRRSLIGRANAADALLAAALHPQPARAIYLARDADWSTPELAREIGRALGVAPRLWRVPPALLRAVAVAHGGLRRLIGSLAVDDARLRAELSWQPRRPPSAEWDLAARALATGEPAA